MKPVAKKTTCVFVHGWAMNSAVWQACENFLPDWIDAIFVDLPGHGSMRDVPASSLDEYVKTVSSVVSRSVVWVGWSLGGLVTLKLAECYPEKVAGLYQVASTPCFVQRDGWSTAVEPQVFQQFSELLKRDVEQTLKRFLALQVMGVTSSRDLLQTLQEAMTTRGLPDARALQSGLDVLMQTDLRQTLSQLHQPVGWTLSERDTLVPVTVKHELEQMNPYIDVVFQQQAGHAPMVSHPQEFVSALVNFIEQKIHVHN